MRNYTNVVLSLSISLLKSLVFFLFFFENKTSLERDLSFMKL